MGLETRSDELAETVEEKDRSLKELLLTLLERLAEVFTTSVQTPLWTGCVLDHYRQLLVEVC